MKSFFYIGNNISTSDSEDLKRGVRIICINSGIVLMKFKELEGPYNSLNQLKMESSIFKNLVEENPPRAKKILEKKFIINARKFIWTRENHTFTMDIIKTIEHLIKGDIRKKKIFGVHYFDQDYMKVNEIINNEDKFGVWKAIVEVYDKKNNKWHLKESTFFPINWSLTQLFHECEFALLNKRKSSAKQYIYFAKTLSGIPVEIVIRNDQLKSIYPLYTE